MATPTLEEMNVNVDDVSFKPITEVALITKGAQIVIGTPLSIADFTALWNSRRRKLKVPTGKDSYAYIVKRRVDFYHISPINK